MSATDPASSTDRAVARALVDAVPPGDPALERDRLLLGDLIAHHPEVAHRTCRPGHLTGSAFVLDDDGERCLLLLHAKLGRWLQPGGHADGETNLALVALREATEESGIADLVVDTRPLDLDIHLVDPPAEDAHLHLDVRFLVTAPPGAEPSGNHESLEIRWVPLGELDRYQPDPSLIRLAAAAVTRRRGWRSSASG